MKKLPSDLHAHQPDAKIELPKDKDFKELENYQYSPNTPMPKSILALMTKPLHDRTSYPINIQRKLHRINSDLFTHLRGTLEDQEITPGEKMAVFNRCLELGLNVRWTDTDDAKTPLIIFAINHDLKTIVTQLLGNPEINVHGSLGIYICISLINSFDTFDLPTSNWFVGVLCQLHNLEFSHDLLLNLIDHFFNELNLTGKKLSQKTSKKLSDLLNMLQKTKRGINLITVNMEKIFLLLSDPEYVSFTQKFFAIQNNPMALADIKQEPPALKLPNTTQGIDTNNTVNTVNTLNQKKLNQQNGALNRLLTDERGAMAHILGFFDIHSIYTLPRVSKSFKKATENVRLGSLISFLSKVTSDNDKSEEKKSLDAQFSSLREKSEVILKKEFEKYRVVKGEKPPANILFLMKELHYRNLFSEGIQDSIAAVEEQMKEFITETLDSDTSSEKKEAYLLSCLDHGLDINSQINYQNENYSLLALCIRYGFKNASLRLLNAREIDVQSYWTVVSIQESFIALSKTMHYEWENEEDEKTSRWVINILIRLKQLFFPRMYLFLILKVFPLGLLCCHESFDNKNAKDILGILEYISQDEKNIQPQEMMTLLSSKFISLLIFQCKSEKCSSADVNKFIDFQIELSTKLPLIDNDTLDNVLSLPNYHPGKRQGDIIAKHVILLKLLFAKAIDQSHFLNRLRLNKTQKQFTLAHIAALDSPTALNEFFNLMFDAITAGFILNIFEIISDNNSKKWNFSHYLAYYGNHDAVKSFNKLLQLLIEQGISAEKIFELQTSQNDEKFIFSHLFIAKNWNCENIILDYQHNLRHYAQNPSDAQQVFSKVLTVQNTRKSCFGHYLSLFTENNLTEHFNLLSNLLHRGISPAAICDYFLTVNEDNESVWQILLHGLTATHLLMWDLLLQLFDSVTAGEEKIEENSSDFYKKLLILLSFKGKYGTCGHYVFINSNLNLDERFYLQMLQHLINKIPIKELLDYLLIQDNQERVVFLGGVSWGSMHPVPILEFLISIMNRTDADAEVAAKILTLLSCQDNKKVDFVMAISAHPSFNLSLLLQLLDTIQQKNPALIVKITDLLKEINITLNPQLTLQHYYQMSPETLRGQLPFKKIYTRPHFHKTINEIIKKYSIKTIHTHVFENTLVTLAGMNEHMGITHFSFRRSREFYPHILIVRLSYTREQVERFVNKLNHLWPGIALLAPQPPGRQRVYLDVEIMNEKILDSGVFETLLQDKIKKNPLLLTAYQMETGKLSKINFENDILHKFKNLPELASLVADNIICIPSNFFSTIISEKLTLPGQIRAVEKKDAEDAEAIALLELQFAADTLPPAIETIVERIDSHFSEKGCTHPFKQEGRTYFIAISKQLLISENFITRLRNHITQEKNKSKKAPAIHSSSLGTIPAIFAPISPEKDTGADLDAEKVKNNVTAHV